MSDESRASAESRKAKRAMDRLKEVANQRPYYRYNGMWSRQIENASFAKIFLFWLGVRFGEGNNVRLEQEGTLLSYEQVALFLGGMQYLRDPTHEKVPTDTDDTKFHLSIEEYLQSLISLINELVPYSPAP